MFLGRMVRAALGLFRSSLQIRALVYTVALSGTALIVLGGVLSVTIGNGLFATRGSHALIESKRANYAVTRLFQDVTGDSTWAINQVAAQVVPELESVGVSQTRKVVFLNVSQKPNGKQIASSASKGVDETLISKEFRARVESVQTIESQTIQVNFDNQSVPAILTGQVIVLPGGHRFELYLIYDMLSEQETLGFVQRTLVLGGTITLFIIGIFSFLVTSWLVKPVQNAAEASELMAEGDLSKRLEVKGSDVVAVLATSFNRMADSLQEKIGALNQLSSMQQRFVSDVSHELRTPLTTMRLSSDLLYESKDRYPDDAKRAAEILHDQIDRFDRLLADLLEISRYDASGITPHFEIQDMNGIVGSALDAIQQFANSKAVYLQVDVPPGPVNVEVDSRRIDRILNNLLTNAIEHSEGKPVKVSVAENESAVAVTVTDNGIGMTEPELNQVFDRFWRADPSRKRTTGGTGLGLAISLEDAIAHNGRLEVTAEYGVGSCFRLTLPKNQEISEFESPIALVVEKLNS